MKKLNFRIVCVIIFMILFESFFYFLAKFSPFEPFLLESFIDNKLHLIEEFIYFYVMWYVMLLVVTYLFYLKDKESFKGYLMTSTGCILISTIIFFFFPTTITRGEVLVTNVTTFVLDFIYFTDTPALNCFPSMHCAICFIFIYYSLFTKKINWPKRIMIIIASSLVIISTLFIKQHVIWDVIGAFVLVILVLILNKIFHVNRLFNKIFKKLKLEIDN